MDPNKTLFKKNRLLVVIIWMMLLLGIAVELMTGAGQSSLVVLAVVGFITCGGATLMTFTRRFERYVMYFIPAILTLLTVLLIMTGPVITTYFLVYVNMAVMTLYSSFRPLLFSAVLGAGLTVYLFFSPYNEALFGNNSPITIMLYLIMIAAPLLASAKFSQILQTQAEQERENAVVENNRTRDMVERITASLQTLNQFSTSLKANVTSTSSISQEVAASFAGVAANLEAQTGSIAEISESARESERSVADLADRATELRASSESSVSHTASGSREAEVMAAKMNHAQALIERSAELMRELNDQNRQIREIAAAINEIASQTHLLALNAAIEASHAGESGRGFAVVSGEIRKLAESSQQSTEQISMILEGILAKTDQAGEQVSQGLRAIVESGEAGVGR
jgi:methyl-accepting chemotaxis protein